MILQHSQSGFSLVETLVAITVLLLVIVGPMSISSSVSHSTSYSTEQVIAFFLAQEGAELAQKARDDFQLMHFASAYLTPWDDFIAKSPSAPYSRCFLTTGCGLEVNRSDSYGGLATPVNCYNNSCRLYFQESGERARYTYSSDNLYGVSNDITPYTRVIYLSHPSGASDKEVEVISRVSWQTGDQRQVQSVEVKTYLFNIYQN